MDASHFPIVEYESDPQWDQGSWQWTSKICLDLRWISSASPERSLGEEWTEIAMTGSASIRRIKALYPDFMRDWTRAKGL